MEANLNEMLTEVEAQIEECATTYSRLKRVISTLIENEYYKEAEWASDQLYGELKYVPETLYEYRSIVGDIRAGVVLN